MGKGYDILYLDGKTENLSWGCKAEQMKELEVALQNVISESDYSIYFSGFCVYWERVTIQLREHSELAKQYPQEREVEHPLHDFNDTTAYIGMPYFHR